MDDASSGAALGLRARRAAAWTVVGFGAAQLVRLASNLLLTRLLFAEAFGLMALVNVFVQGLNLFSDIGIQPSIVRDRRGTDRAFLDTAWTIQVLRGALLWLVACAAAIPFARFYGEGALAWMLPVAALTAILAGFNSTKLHTASRELAQGRITMIELASQALGVAVMIAWALVDRSVWALVAGGLAGSGSKLILGHLAIPGPGNHFRWEGEAVTSLVRFGRWIFVSTALTFFASQSDRLIFGRLVPLDLLGVYSIGVMIAALPISILMRLTSSVAFPVYSRIHDAGGVFEREFRSARWPILVVGGWALCGLVAGGPTAIRLLYDPRYEEAGWVVQVLALGAWFHVAEATNGAALLAQGKSYWVAAGSAAKLAAMLVLIPLGFYWLHFPGAVAGYAASEIFRYGVSALARSRSGLRGWSQDLPLTALLLVVAAIVWLGSEQLRARGVHVVIEAAAVAVAVTVCWLPLAIPLLSRHLGRREVRSAAV